MNGGDSRTALNLSEFQTTLLGEKAENSIPRDQRNSVIN
jgi:hypothetical protein